MKNDLISIGNIVDDRGNHNFLKVVYENLNEAELIEWVERFYGEYYFSHEGDLAHGPEGDIQSARPQNDWVKEAREYMAALREPGARKFIFRTRGSRRPCPPMPETRDLRAKTRLFAVLSVLTNVAGNSALAHEGHAASRRSGQHARGADRRVVPSVGRARSRVVDCLDTHPHFGTFLSWSGISVSHVMPVTAFSYVVTALAARFFLGETVSPMRWAGIVLITSGVRSASARTTVASGGSQ